MTRRAEWSRSVPGPGRFPPPFDARFTIGTAAAASPAAASASARGIISVTGPTGAPPRSRTSRFFAADITAPSTRRATRSRAGSTGRSDSGGPTATRCLRCRRLQQCSVIPSRLSAGATTRRACASTRGRRAPAGSGNGWIWRGRSTSCTPWPREPDLVDHPNRNRRRSCSRRAWRRRNAPPSDDPRGPRRRSWRVEGRGPASSSGTLRGSARPCRPQRHGQDHARALDHRLHAGPRVA